MAGGVVSTVAATVLGPVTAVPSLTVIVNPALVSVLPSCRKPTWPAASWVCVNVPLARSAVPLTRTCPRVVPVTV
ncbi:hypothetical protein MPOCJGCO_3246 [Methylobacterium trifolii]|uniref:Secreted protein n=1 Tax=Methylobacterium trifolii TaxID=1003092 RepID=A0ABQ4U4U4_9HYPH|nr:hypothetical protein MPOCJGCO_3246 [Methylobacterium trifolii]